MEKFIVKVCLELWFAFLRKVGHITSWLCYYYLDLRLTFFFVVIFFLVWNVLRVIRGCLCAIQPFIRCFLDCSYSFTSLWPTKILAISLLALWSTPFHEVIRPNGFVKLGLFEIGGIDWGVLMRGKEGLGAGEGTDMMIESSFASRYFFMWVSDSIFFSWRRRPFHSISNKNINIIIFLFHP